MAIQDVFDTMKRGGYIIQEWEKFLLKKQDKDNDRVRNINAPSQIGNCLRARYYSRMGYPSARISAKAERIFNNGTYVHERIQKDLRDCGILILDEVPVFNDHYLIQGHTDGIIKLNDDELGVLEIKSINLRNFTELKSTKPEHVAQGLTYLYCLEQHRQHLKKSFKTSYEFAISWKKERLPVYSAMYSHLRDGSMYTKMDKLNFQLSLHRELDVILYHLEIPITKVVFLYECKDNQELKEFIVDSNDEDAKKTIQQVLNECEILNKCIDEGKVPNRYEGAKRNSGICRWCSYQDECFVV